MFVKKHQIWFFDNLYIVLFLFRIILNSDMKKIRVLIADGSYIFSEGLKNILNVEKNIEVLACISEFNNLENLLSETEAELLMIDYSSRFFDEHKLSEVCLKFPNIKVIAITSELPRIRIATAIRSGINGYLLKDCCKEEIIEAVNETINGKQFFCGNVFGILQETEEEKTDKCEGVSLSKREIEIIQLIAEGLTNKEIADKLFLSSHTVNTHRKNIMHKLRLKNTAGIVIYALKENLIHAD